MKVLIIYDSKFGNTEKVARAMGEALDGQVVVVQDVKPDEVNVFDLVIIGSPTHGGFPTEGIHELVKDKAALAGLKTAAFDTRTDRTIFGYAAPKIARNLEKNRANLLASPEGFFVEGKKGPLREGELGRAAAWAKKVAEGDIP